MMAALFWSGNEVNRHIQKICWRICELFNQAQWIYWWCHDHVLWHKYACSLRCCFELETMTGSWDLGEFRFFSINNFHQEYFFSRYDSNKVCFLHYKASGCGRNALRFLSWDSSISIKIFSGSFQHICIEQFLRPDWNITLCSRSEGLHRREIYCPHSEFNMHTKKGESVTIHHFSRWKAFIK